MGDVANDHVKVSDYDLARKMQLKPLLFAPENWVDRESNLADFSCSRKELAIATSESGLVRQDSGSPSFARPYPARSSDPESIPPTSNPLRGITAMADLVKGCPLSNSAPESIGYLGKITLGGSHAKLDWSQETRSYSILQSVEQATIVGTTWQEPSPFSLPNNDLEGASLDGCSSDCPFSFPHGEQPNKLCVQNIKNANSFASAVRPSLLTHLCGKRTREESSSQETARLLGCHRSPSVKSVPQLRGQTSNHKLGLDARYMFGEVVAKAGVGIICDMSLPWVPTPMTVPTGSTTVSQAPEPVWLPAESEIRSAVSPSPPPALPATRLLHTSRRDSHLEAAAIDRRSAVSPAPPDSTPATSLQQGCQEQLNFRATATPRSELYFIPFTLTANTPLLVFTDEANRSLDNKDDDAEGARSFSPPEEGSDTEADSWSDVDSGRWAPWSLMGEVMGIYKPSLIEPPFGHVPVPLGPLEAISSMAMPISAPEDDINNTQENDMNNNIF
eukprot:gene20151-26885_t